MIVCISQTTHVATYSTNSLHRFSNAFNSLAFSSSTSIENCPNQRPSPYISLQPLTSMLSRASAPSVLNPLTSLATNTYFPARQIRSSTQPQRAYLIKVKSEPHVPKYRGIVRAQRHGHPIVQQRGQRMHQHRRCQALSRLSRGVRGTIGLMAHQDLVPS